MNWYSYSEHLEKRVIGTKLLEVRCENNKKELFKAI